MFQVWLKSLDSYSKYCPGIQNMGLSRADNVIKIWRNSPISNPKPDLHNINTNTKFGENPLMFTQVIIWKQNTHTDGRMDRRTMDGGTNGHRDIQHETMIPHHYRVTGYKNENFQMKSSGSFHISAQNIDCGYSLELPYWGGSNDYPVVLIRTASWGRCNKYPQFMLLSRNKN